MIKDIKLLNNESINKKEFNNLITNELLEFLKILHREFESRRQQLLKDRVVIQSSIVTNYLETKKSTTSNQSIQLKRPRETLEIRNDPTWKVREIPEILKDRKVDIVCLDVSDYEALKRCVLSGANGIQVDFDDGYSPSWLNGLKAQKNIYDIVRDPQLNTPESALLLVRPRSLNLDEMHILIDGKPLSGTIFDMATFLFHNAQKLSESGRGPFFYIPKIENYKEAIFWNDLLSKCEQLLSITPFSCKSIVLIENVLASHEMEEIIYYLRDYVIALNTGRWDYIFSYIKKLSEFPQYNIPQKSKLGFNQDFLNSYYRLLAMVAHRRGCLATGGMAPQSPSTPTGTLSDKELLSVFNGKRDEAKMGFDGALVAHFSSVSPCRDAFKQIIGNNHLNHLTNFRHLNYTPLEAANHYSKLLETCQSTLNEQLIANVSINDVKSCLKVLYIYIYNWIFKFKGAVNVDGVVEDLATSEINRVLLWKWLKYGVEIKEENNSPLTIDLILKLLTDSQSLVNGNTPQKHSTVIKIILIFLTTNQLIDFMPSILYPYILDLNLLSKQ
ncbi:hypothetical protein DICPUDRAFT_25628 [Dictyostelium purpureum]|uniref:malate synthase n=1 Tax=Dictyostelium purpureum TaxID=5786 RepID=F0Z7H0_DICPU|nr:uncharacterized protein DICPUDRAFT_25628 [Dictyostelium purpureum]EGC40140.1 hypothetical protein DICPUDRAFT_25628 [Dictyostelium purpureum]|eukprot:XP_003283330.1 hypothetical protein DICPUDRAFT_25628 [Dictyostelium purpureum]